MRLKMEGFIKRVISILLLLSFLQFSCFTQSSVQFNITKLEDNLIQLENNSLLQQKQIEDLQFSLDNANLLSMTLQTQLTETSQTLENASNSLKKSELKSEVLKWSLIIGVPTSFIAGMMIGLACQRR